jgi:hypothetical protein
VFTTELHFSAEGGFSAGRLETRRHWLRFLAVTAQPAAIDPPAILAPELVTSSLSHAHIQL